MKGKSRAWLGREVEAALARAGCSNRSLPLWPIHFGAILAERDGAQSDADCQKNHRRVIRGSLGQDKDEIGSSIILNPKIESRNPKETRMPKSETDLPLR